MLILFSPYGRPMFLLPYCHHLLHFKQLKSRLSRVLIQLYSILMFPTVNFLATATRNHRA